MIYKIYEVIEVGEELFCAICGENVRGHIKRMPFIAKIVENVGGHNYFKDKEILLDVCRECDSTEKIQSFASKFLCETFNGMKQEINANHVRFAYPLGINQKTHWFMNNRERER